VGELGDSEYLAYLKTRLTVPGGRAGQILRHKKPSVSHEVFAQVTRTPRWALLLLGCKTFSLPRNNDRMCEWCDSRVCCERADQMRFQPNLM
jgi:hypothetical protein